jgi:hypothetical protein
MEQFTDAIERSLQTSNWYAALLVALALPDIAGWVDDPTATSRARYAAWVEQFVSPDYTREVGPARTRHKFLSGDDCYALRCSVLHEGRDETSHQWASDALDRFQFVAPLKGWTIHCNQADTKLQLQVDIFCRDICRGVQNWLLSIPVADQDRRDRLAQLVFIHVGPGLQV